MKPLLLIRFKKKLKGLKREVKREEEREEKREAKREVKKPQVKKVGQRVEVEKKNKVKINEML